MKDDQTADEQAADVQKTDPHREQEQTSAVDERPDLKYANAKEATKGGVLGAFIGLAIIVPGVSGSAVAIIMKLYEKLLYALGNIFKDFKRCILFLIPIGIGAVIGFVLGFFGVKVLLEVAMFAVVGLFAGLMLGAFPAVTDEIKGERHSPFRVTLFILGVIIPIALSLISVFLGEDEVNIASPKAYEYIIYVLLGILVALTQLVPGLSATALLMMTGHYVPLMDSVSPTYWQSNPQVFAVYACLIVGFVVGLLGLAKLMSLLLKKFRVATFHTVAGLSLGSIITMFFNTEVYAEYCNWANGEPFALMLVLAVVLFAVGIVIAYMFVRVQRKKSMLQ